MGRPLNKKYFGKRNTGAAGTFGNTNLLPTDYDLGGVKVNGIGSITAGSFTGAQADAATLTFPTPALASEGGQTATGTPNFKVLTTTVGGTQTQAYASTDVLSDTFGGVTSTYTPTLTSYSANTISATAISANAITLGTAITAVKGTSFLFPAGVTGVTGLTPGTTYYIAASVSSSSTVTLASTPTGSVLTISGTPGGTLTGVTIGASTASVASVTVVNGGVIPKGSVAAYAAATTVTASVSAGAGLTLGGTVSFGLTSATITSTGNGYINTVPVTPSITSTTLTSIASGAYGTITVGSVTNTITLGTAQSANTFYVGQVVTFTGTAGGAGTLGGYTTGKSYLVSATNGTSTLTFTNVDGTAVTGGVAGGVTGLTIVLYKATVSSTDQLVPGLVVTTTGTGGSLTAGTYYIIAVNGATEIVLSSSAGGNATAVTTATSTATTVVSGNVAVTINSNQGAAASMTFAAQVTTGYTGNYATIQAQALATTGGVVRQDTDIIKQENTQRFRVENADGVFYAKLVTAFPTVGGTMAINATDSAGNTYWVSKITNRRCRVTRNTGTQFADGATVNWTFGSPVASVSVKIDNA